MENRKYRVSRKDKIILWLMLVPLLVFVALWHLLLRSTMVVHESAKWTANSAQIFRLIGEVESKPDPSQVPQEVAGLLSQIAALVGSDPAQSRRLLELSKSWASTGIRDVGELSRVLAATREEQMHVLPAYMQDSEDAIFRLELSSAALFMLDLLVIGCACVALWRVRRMRGYVTACAWTQTILHEGQWLSFEDYLKQRFDVELSHGVSPQMLEKIENGWRQTSPLSLPASS